MFKIRIHLVAHPDENRQIAINCDAHGVAHGKAGRIVVFVI
jgi:hypothetical protein